MTIKTLSQFSTTIKFFFILNNIYSIKSKGKQNRELYFILAVDKLNEIAILQLNSFIGIK